MSRSSFHTTKSVISDSFSLFFVWLIWTLKVDKFSLTVGKSLPKCHNNHFSCELVPVRPSIWTTMTRRRLKIAFELIWHRQQRSVQLSSELVWPAAIPVWGRPHPIMLCLPDWEGAGVWDHWGLVQMSAGSPLKSSLAQEAINRRPPPSPPTPA